MSTYKSGDGECYVLLGRKKEKGCDFKGLDTIRFEGAFDSYGEDGYFGDIELVFDAYNPRTNKDLG